MSKRPKAQGAVSDKRRRKATDPLKQPGVREAMAVYEAWRKVDGETAPYRRAMSNRVVVSVSDGAGPMTRRIS